MKSNTIQRRALLGRCLFIVMLTITQITYAQIGNVLWEDQFDSFNANVWTPNVGDGCDIGLCGWGNAELQYYQPDNVTIEGIPGEPGNNALVLEARNESAGTRAFTSGKVDSEGKMSIHYGLIEVRMMVPNLETGLWPAAWLLGTANLTWPGKGEIDMMEMGHSLAARTEQGHGSSTVNNYVGANAIFATPDGPGSIAYDADYNQPYQSATPMNNRFMTYRLYWDPTEMRFTVIDNGTEYDLYTGPLPIDPDGVTGAFSKPFYMLLNLAVGGNFTDAASNGQVTAPMPAKMYVDYVRVSEWNGHGEVSFDYGELVAETGVFGVYTDETPTNNSLTFGGDAEIYAWGGTVQEGTTAPYEGDNVIAWETTAANSWFGGGVTTLFGKNMSNYSEEGVLRFKIKIPADVSFRIGITDNYTNEAYVDFPANQTTYGLVRNGEWGSVEIPLSDLAGLIAFQDIGYMFAIVSDAANLPTSTFQFAIDDITWYDGNDTQIILTSIQVTPQNTSIDEGTTQQFSAQAFDQNGNPMSANFSWSTNGGSISSSGLYSGNAVGNYTVSASSSGVTGATSITVNATSSGVNVPAILQAEDYKEGGEGVGYHETTTANIGGAYRSDAVDIEATGDTGGGYNVGWIANGEWLAYDINATAGSNTYDLTARVASPNGNGSFHFEIDGTDISGTLSVPNTGSWQSYVDITAEGVSISSGNHELRVVFDNAGLNLNYIDVAEASEQRYLNSVVVNPQNASIDEGQTIQFSAEGLDQFGDPFSAAFSWFATGGSINGSGLYTGSTAGTFTVTASSGSVSGSSDITVNTVSNAWTLPGRIEAENFNGGGEGIGYHDLTSGNTGGAFRLGEDVDIEATGDSDGLYNVGWIDAGEWIEFDINATASSGEYELDFRLASPSGAGSLHVEIDGVNITGTVNAPNTGGWQSYATVSVPASISPGSHSLRIVFESAGLNINYLEGREVAGTDCTGGPENGDYTYSVSGGNNPEITFNSGYPGVGDGIVILYYGTTPTGGYPGYISSPGSPFALSGVSSGQTVYFYYTYSVPEGGERNTSANRHSFVVGECGSGARIDAGAEKDIEVNDSQVLLYPVPANKTLTINHIKGISRAEIYDATGRIYQSHQVGQNADKIELQIEELPSGIFLIRLIGENLQLTKQFIKQ